MWRAVVLAGLWGALVALDRRAFLQAMLSRPLVAATGVGLLLGDPTAGVFVGLVFELAHLGDASLGGALPDNDLLPALAAASFTCALGEATGAPATPAMWALGMLLFAPLGVVGRRVEGLLDVRARKYAVRAKAAADSGDMQRVARQNLRAIWPSITVAALLAANAALLGILAAPYESGCPLWLLRGLGWAYPALGTVAAGAAVQRTDSSHRYLAGGIGAGVMALVARFWL
jgi:mannose/fructose/N-acetylgalactosamine-specific phosphotransferase system component IIC